MGLDFKADHLLLQVETEKILKKLATQTEFGTELINSNIQPKDLKLIDNVIVIKINDDEIEKLNIINANNQLEAKYEDY